MYTRVQCAECCKCCFEQAWNIFSAGLSLPRADQDTMLRGLVHVTFKCLPVGLAWSWLHAYVDTLPMHGTRTQCSAVRT